MRQVMRSVNSVWRASEEMSVVDTRKNSWRARRSAIHAPPTTMRLLVSGSISIPNVDSRGLRMLQFPRRASGVSAGFTPLSGGSGMPLWLLSIEISSANAWTPRQECILPSLVNLFLCWFPGRRSEENAGHSRLTTPLRNVLVASSSSTHDVPFPARTASLDTRPMARNHAASGSGTSMGPTHAAGSTIVLQK